MSIRRLASLGGYGPAIQGHLRRRLVPVVAMLVTAPLSAYAADPGPKVGDSLPDATFVSIEGMQVSLKPPAGKLLHVHFWYPDVSITDELAKSAVVLFRRFHGKGLNTLTVCFSRREERPLYLAEKWKLRGVSGGLDGHIEGLMDAFHLTAKRSHWISHLSEGMRRKLTMLQALAGQPPLLILDEPTSGLDIEVQTVCREHLAACSREGATLLIGTHDFRLLDALQPRIPFLSEDRQVAAGPMPTLLAQHGCRTADKLVLRLWT